MNEYTILREELGRLEEQLEVVNSQLREKKLIVNRGDRVEDYLTVRRMQKEEKRLNQVWDLLLKEL